MKTILYSWKGGEFKELRQYPASYAEWELDKLKELYSYEYKFKLKQ